MSIIGVNLQEQMEYIVDSCPIILAKGPRSGHAKVARELCEKSYNSSRKEWYYGIKLHAVVARKPGHLPIPMSLMASGAAQHDLPVAKQLIEDHASLKPGKLYADKAYMDAAWAQSLNLTDIQTASMVRSLSGLLFHLFGRIAAALAILLFNP